MDLTSTPPDVYIGCHGDLTGWGGTVVEGRALAAACRRVGWTTVLLGLGERQLKAAQRVAGKEFRVAGLAGSASEVSNQDPEFNIPTPPLPGLWRLHKWCIPRILARRLAEFPAPRGAFVSFSPFWTVAAKRVWPDVPVVFRFCGLLSNCLPFTRPAGKRRGFWDRLGDAGIRAGEHAALRLADRILVPAAEHAAEIAAFEPLCRRSRAGAKVVECLEGCEQYNISSGLRRAQRARLRLASSDFLVVTVGSCDHNKAFEHAIRELARTAGRAHLVIVGEGPERDELQSLAYQLGLAGRAHLVGRQAELAPWYAAADCVVSTSFYDTFPNVIQEALWCGRVVVVPAHDPPRVYAGISGFVQREGVGLLYDRLRPGALAQRWNQLMQNEPLAASLARRGQAAARCLFDWADTLRHVAELGNLRGVDPEPAGRGRRPTAASPAEERRCLTASTPGG